jgi:hypothetical protein
MLAAVIVAVAIVLHAIISSVMHARSTLAYAEHAKQTELDLITAKEFRRDAARASFQRDMDATMDMVAKAIRDLTPEPAKGEPAMGADAGRGDGA